MYGVTSKLFTSAAILTGCADASKLRIGPTPLMPFKQADQKASLPIPLGATTPRPVMTTLRISAYLFRISIPETPCLGNASPAGPADRFEDVWCGLLSSASSHTA